MCSKVSPHLIMILSIVMQTVKLQVISVYIAVWSAATTVIISQPAYDSGSTIAILSTGRTGDAVGVSEPAFAVSDASLPSSTMSKTLFTPSASQLGTQHLGRVQSPRSYQTPSPPLPPRHNRVSHNGCPTQLFYTEPEFSCDSTAIGRIPSGVRSASPMPSWENASTPAGHSWPAAIAELGQEFPDAVPRLWSTPYRKKAPSAAEGRAWLAQPRGR